MHTVLSSASKTVVIGDDQPFCIIGERINPTGRKKFQEQLRAGDLSAIETDVAAQVAGGAMVLDVNMGVPLTDEAELLSRAVKLVQGLTDLPLCIDSSVVEALEAGLAAYEGKALVNSVTVEDERMELILPLVKRHNAAIIALPNDETEIPIDPVRRVELTKKFVDIATTKYGIDIENIVIDPLAMPIGADSLHAARTMDAISMIREGIGVNMTLGASNVSFGMPDRHTLGAVFLPMAMRAGLTSAIMDARTPNVVSAVKGADLMLGHDEWGATWIQLHRSRLIAETAPAASATA
jgi:5-methyltetrahydrofolate--homocysteine methyltransferase